MTTDEAILLLNQYIKSERMLNHCYASEAVMRALARRLGRDEEKWGIAGLLHDLDVELVNADLNIHGRETEKILKEKGLEPEIIEAIVMHNETLTGKKRHTEIQHALAAAETITGLIIATTLVYPDKKIASVKPKSVVKRMKEKAFAASVNRDNIMECESIGIPLAEFVDISINAMRDISDKLGL
ncbi:MAG: HD domain-containing protein [Syntrophorhabdaceae bacterium]|jgi:putative nucleotidyltransferase with HDIG domain|nr:HD domain-containing protein [Syntrophorhabdaceae bacterium]MBP8699234.1 HD domain-containing protein [Syntrophorhabdaceae bacterium]